MVQAYDPSYRGGRGRRTVIEGQPLAKIVRPYLKNKLMQKWLEW